MRFLRKFSILDCSLNGKRPLNRRCNMRGKLLSRHRNGILCAINDAIICRARHYRCGGTLPDPLKLPQSRSLSNERRIRTHMGRKTIYVSNLLGPLRNSSSKFVGLHHHRILLQLIALQSTLLCIPLVSCLSLYRENLLVELGSQIYLHYRGHETAHSRNSYLHQGLI